MVEVTPLATSFGTLWLAANEHGLCRLALPTEQEHTRFQQWVTSRALPAPLFHKGRENKSLALAKKELREYLAGKRHQFTVPLALEGSTFFQQVWDALVGIPYGRTMTYAALATALQRPRAFRAVGSACAKNPVPLIIPCHRAVGSNGSLTGFAGGLAMKEALLQMEGAIGG